MSSRLSTKPTIGGETPRGAGDVVEGAQIALDEGRLEQQVLGRIAGHGQLRERHQLGPHPSGSANPVDDLPRVTFEVSHGWVDLGEGDPEGASYRYCTRQPVVIYARSTARPTRSPAQLDAHVTPAKA